MYRGFEELKELMDVGGGDGAMIAKLVSMSPHIHGVTSIYQVLLPRLLHIKVSSTYSANHHHHIYVKP